MALSRAQRGLTVLAAVAVLAGVAVVLVLRAATQGGWLAAAVRSRLFVTCGAVLLGSAAAFWVAAGVLWQAGAQGRRQRRAQDGTAMIEFALVLPIALTLVLLMVQSSLLMVGNLCVNYAAYCAARSAIVQVPRDLGDVEGPNIVLDDLQASEKLQRIQSAAVWAVLPVSSSSEDVQEGDAGRLNGALSNFFSQYGVDEPGWVGPYLARKLAYAEQYTVTEISAPDDGATYGEREDIRANVRHTFYLSIPYASWVFRKFAGDEGVTLDFGSGQRGIIIEASCTLTNEGLQDYVDVEHFPPQ